MVTSRRRTGRFVDDQGAAAEVNRLRMVAAGLEDEVAALRRRLQDSPKRVRTLEERLLESKSQTTILITLPRCDNQITFPYHYNLEIKL